MLDRALDPGAVATHIQHPVRRGGGIDIRQQAAEVGFVVGLGHAGRLGDEVPVRLGRRQAVGLAGQDRLDLQHDQPQRHVVADQVVVEQRQQPLPARLILDDVCSDQRRSLQIEAQMMGVGRVTQDLQGVFAGEAVQGHHRQLRLAMDDLHRLRQALPTQGGAQDVVAVDHYLHGGQEVIEQPAPAERHHRAHQVRIAFGLQQVMEQDAFLQRRQRVDVLHIGGAAGNIGDDLLDFLLAEGHQRQHVRFDGGAIGGDQVLRYDPLCGVAAGQDRGHGLEGRRREHRAHVQLQVGLAQTLDQADDQEGMATEFEEVVLATHPFYPEQLLPGIGQGDFDGAQRRFVTLARRGGGVRCR